MRRYLITSLICFAIAAYAATFIGCASTATVARMDGFDAQWRGFASINAPAAKHTSVITITVIVDDSLPANIAGTYSHPQGIVRVKGKVVKGKIIVPEAVLGHEVLHALQFKTGAYADPDKLTELGY